VDNQLPFGDPGRSGNGRVLSALAFQANEGLLGKERRFATVGDAKDSQRRRETLGVTEGSRRRNHKGGKETRKIFHRKRFSVGVLLSRSSFLSNLWGREMLRLQETLFVGQKRLPLFTERPLSDGAARLSPKHMKEKRGSVTRAAKGYPFESYPRGGGGSAFLKGTLRDRWQRIVFPQAGEE